MMWRGKDVVYNIQGHLVFVVPNELLVIAYRELPSGGVIDYPPGPPHGRGVIPPPTTTPQHGGGAAPPPLNPPCSACLSGVRAVCEILGGGCCSWYVLLG